VRLRDRTKADRLLPELCPGSAVAESEGEDVKQLSLYEAQTIGAPHNGTDTSVTAAVAAAPKAPTQKKQILWWIAACEGYGATEDEIEVGMGFLRSAICARVNELVKEGLLRDSGQRRETRWNRPAIVWVLTSPVTSESFRGQ